MSGIGRPHRLSMHDFFQRYGTEEQCREALFSKCCPCGFVCPKCKGGNYYIRPPKQIMCASCRHITSVTAGTVMHQTHLTLVQWFMAMYVDSESKRGISAVELARKIGVRYTTAWYVLQRLRSAMSQREEEYLLDGVVDVDGMLVGGVAPGRPGRSDQASAMPHCGESRYRRQTQIHARQTRKWLGSA